MGVVEPVQVSLVHAFAESARAGESQTIVRGTIGNDDVVGTIRARRSLVPQLCFPTLVRGFQ